MHAAPKARHAAAQLGRQQHQAMHKEVLAAAAVVLTFLMYVPYIRSVHKGRTKPHAFSWGIWTLSGLVVFVAQLSDRAGAGAWPIGMASLISAYVAILAYAKRTNTSATRTDWCFLAVALGALVCWLATSNPLTAVVLLTGAELAGFGPTFRHASNYPHQERISFFSLGAMRNALALAALEHYSLTTALFPSAKLLTSAVLVVMIWYWRSRLSVRGECGERV